MHEAAHLLDREAAASVEARRCEYRQLLATLSRERATVGPLEPAIGHFLKVTKSYWRGLFQCYEFTDLPRTNNDLEQVFGSVRHHERRATGRKGASPGAVVRGAVRLIAAVATRLGSFGPAQLCPRDREALTTLLRILDRGTSTPVAKGPDGRPIDAPLYLHPTAVYGIVLLCAAIAYYILQTMLLRAGGESSVLRTALGSDVKGKISPVIYAAAIPLAFVNRWLALACYAAITLIWLVPDRRLESHLTS